MPIQRQVNVTFLQDQSFGIASITAGTTGDMDEDLARGLGGQIVKINGPATGTPILSPVSGARNLASGVPVSIFGDSITQDHYETTAATAVYERVRWFSAANALLGQRMRLVQNAGVNGETTTQMLARLTGNGPNPGAGFGALGSTASAVTSSPSPLYGAPKLCFVHGGVNDIYGSSLPAATVIANLQSIYAGLMSAGVAPIAMTIMAVNSTTVGYSTANVATHLEVNRWIRTYCQANNIQMVDAFAATVDPTSATGVEMNTLLTRDGKQHPGNRGGWAVGRAIYNLLVNILPARDILPQSNLETIALDPSIKQLLTNPLLTGTAAITSTGYSGTAAGSNLANANFVRGGSASAVLSAVTRADGYGQNTKFVCTFTASGDNLEFRGPSMHANAVVGAQYIAVCEAVVTGPSGAALAAADNLMGVQLYLQYNDGTTNYLTYALATNITQDYAMADGSKTITLKTPVFTLPASGTPTTFRPNVTIYGKGAGNPEVQLGRIGLYRVD